ncbi:phytoene desaturase family protein [Ferribacterium limneticum]|uniref:phytoene desaturase family protein n=1 Tax=Ferribacterium limneticum TaxID=76259 RepID=UPI001CF80988|nr:NAD(P)/FAD-dependent oxidoreductase [Ferribacterium limneticum]UCV23598.1 NAD(P)/FAD-dependent oxidoreductase [Ferribacterium limneticum]
MRDSTYDVVVVGGGSNTLTAAGYLAKVGKSVLVLEKNEVCGGGVVSMSPAPGFICDPHAMGMVTCMPNPVIANDELGLLSRFGLEFVRPDASFSTVFDDNAGLVTYVDLDKACEEIAKFSTRDAEVYRQFVLDCREYLPLILKGLYTPPLPFGGFVSLLEQSSKGRRLVTAMMESAFDVVDDLFESPELKMHILKWVAELMVGPEVRGTGIIPFLLMGIAHTFKAGMVIGGSQNMTRALVRCVEAYGGIIRTNAQVVKMNVSGGRVTGVTLKDGEIIKARDAVIGCIHPWDLDKFIEGIDPSVTEAASKVKLSSHGAINQQYALSEAPIWKAGSQFEPAMLVECLRRDRTMESMRVAFDEYRYGRMPLDHLSPLVGIQSRLDPTRAPAGKATMYLYHFAPLELQKGGLEGWDDIKEETADAIYDEMCKYTTNMDRSKIIARHVETPLDHHRHSASMRNGDIFGIGTFTSQFFGRRPTPELAQYRIPGIEGFYLCGPFMHPGGSVTLGGRATAMKMLMDWKIDLKKAFISL